MKVSLSAESIFILFFNKALIHVESQSLSGFIYLNVKLHNETSAPVKKNFSCLARRSLKIIVLYDLLGIVVCVGDHSHFYGIESWLKMD